MKAAHLVCCVATLAAALSGCAADQAQQQAKQNADLAARAKAAIANCNANFPSNATGIAVQRMQCLNDAEMIELPTYGSDQDLMLAYMTANMVLAEKLQAGKMTVAEYNAAIAAGGSRVASESQQRANARNAANAQSFAAAAAFVQATRPPAAQSPPVATTAPVVNPSFTCVRSGTVTTCN
jgi:hypothetical protein